MSNAENGLIKGQGLVLVTGKKGSGKSHFVTNQIKYIVDNFPDHKVFADIDGLNIPGVEKSPENWMDAPKNSTIIYDEAQRLPWADNSSTKISSDARVREMTMIRHENKNIVLITQDPTFIHSALRKLVDIHYHISHPFKDGKPKVFKFFGAMSQIDDKGVYRSHAQETFTYPLTDDISKLYKSVDDDAVHDQKRKYPKKVIYMIIFIVCLVLVFIPLGYFGIKRVGGFIFGAKERGNKEMAVANKNLNVIKEDGSIDPAAANPIDATSGFKNIEQHNQEIENRRIYLYKQDLPEDYQIRRTDPMLQVRGVMQMGNKCIAYNAYGDRMELSQKECKSYVGTGKVYRSEMQTNSQAYQEQQPATTEPIPAQNQTNTAATENNS